MLVAADLIRAASTTAAAVSLLTGHLRLRQLLVLALVNAFCAVFTQIGHSVALRHVVPPAQLPHAFALNDGRGHAISLTGQPVGGYLYGPSSALPLLADILTFTVSAVLTATIRHPLRDTTPAPATRHRFRDELLTGLQFLWADPLLRATLLAAASFQLVFAAATFALIADLNAHGTTPALLGAMFAIAAAGGILGALLTPRLQARFPARTLILVLFWTAAAALTALALTRQPLIAGALLAVVYLIGTPANANLLTAQINRTPHPCKAASSPRPSSSPASPHPSAHPPAEHSSTTPEQHPPSSPSADSQPWSPWPSTSSQPYATLTRPPARNGTTHSSRGANPAAQAAQPPDVEMLRPCCLGPRNA